MVRIYHNPRCTKSRQTLDLLKEKGEMPVIIEYLKTPPSADEIRSLVELLGVQPIQLVRKHEQEFNQYKGAELSDEEVIEILAKHPKLIERPIVVNGKKAAIGRPPENVLEIL